LTPINGKLLLISKPGLPISGKEEEKINMGGCGELVDSLIEITLSC
jgi:hypothetical protein